MTVLTASAIHYGNLDRAMGAEFSARFDTMDEAKAFVALFPKSTTFSTSQVSDPLDHNNDYATAKVRISLSPKAGNDRNETGIARYHAIVKKAGSLGVTVEWEARYGNSYATREVFEAAIA